VAETLILHKSGSHYAFKKKYKVFDNEISFNIGKIPFPNGMYLDVIEVDHENKTFVTAAINNDERVGKYQWEYVDSEAKPESGDAVIRAEGSWGECNPGTITKVKSVNTGTVRLEKDGYSHKIGCIMKIAKVNKCYNGNSVDRVAEESVLKVPKNKVRLV
jgi:hypothetical protein